MTLRLSQSYMTTVLNALARSGNTQSIGTLEELERQGIVLPVWIQRDVMKR